MELALFIYIASVFSKAGFILKMVGLIGLVIVAIYIICCIDADRVINKVYCSLPGCCWKRSVFRHVRSRSAQNRLY